jgi:hypothetical protein
MIVNQPFNNNNDKDRFGYYTVGDFKTYSKFEAIEISQLVRKLPVWHFNDIEFANYRWDIEPLESLSELYAKRARQIRDKYDHIVIFYSGGVDSGNVVNSFVDNGITFEEIATYNYLELDSRPDSFFNGEQTRVSYPRIRELHDQGVNFLHRSIDMTKIAHKIFTDSFWNTHRAYFCNGHWGTSHIAKTYIREWVDDYKKIIESGKKLVFVWGLDKPRLHIRNGKFVLQFIDSAIDAGPGIRTQIMNRDWEHDELFYWSPDSIDIMCKQGHIIKNFLRKYTNTITDDHLCMEGKNLSDAIIENPMVVDMFKHSKIKHNITNRNLTNSLIYPKFDINMYSVGKPPVFIYSQKEQYWYKDIIMKHQVDLLASHFNSINTNWLVDPTNADLGLKKFLSPPYFLE